MVDADAAVDAVREAIIDQRAGMVVVDSIQTVEDPSLPSAPGSVAQVRACAQRLAEVARAEGVVCVLIGHVTKDGAIAGPRALEHLVDTVLSFDADAPHGLRLLRADKHRYGPTGEVGVFTLEGDGMQGVDDVGVRFLGDRRGTAPGSVVLPVIEGRRTVLAEVQALVTRREGGAAARVCQGVERKRLEVVLAVLNRRTGVDGDVYVSVVGGVRIGEPGGDLAVALSVMSAALELPVDPGLVVCGEVGLTGEIRQVPLVARRSP